MDWINGKMLSLNYDRTKQCWVLSLRVNKGEDLEKARKLCVSLKGRETKLGYESEEAKA